MVSELKDILVLLFCMNSQSEFVFRLLHATRAMRSSTQSAPMKEGERISNPNNALDSIIVTHRPKGGNEWLEGYGADPRTAADISYESRSNIGDTGTQHPHGTKYKPKMVRFQSSGEIFESRLIWL
jgi:hypothetical protein